MNLNSQLCEEIGLTYWQLNTETPKESFNISSEEKELLRKILLAKSIQLKDEILEITEDGIAQINLPKFTLIFRDANLENTENIINLAKLSTMLTDNQQKKLTWFKLKNLELSQL